MVQAPVNLTLDYNKTLYKEIPLGLIFRMQLRQNAEAMLPSEVSYQAHVISEMQDFHFLPIKYHTFAEYIMSIL